MTTYTASDDRMPEAEVAARLAIYLLNLSDAPVAARLCIDGAQVRSSGRVIFAIQQFLTDEGWRCDAPTDTWRGTDIKGSQQMTISSHSGQGDLTCHIGGRRIYAECEGGPLQRAKDSKEYKQIWTALGQLLGTPEDPNTQLLAAFPYSNKFQALANEWNSKSRVRAMGIRLVLVNRNGDVVGLEDWNTRALPT